MLKLTSPIDQSSWKTSLNIDKFLMVQNNMNSYNIKKKMPKVCNMLWSDKNMKDVGIELHIIIQ